ncbi:LuxR C-terminal-related transcriptional regulator [Brachybacterium sp. GPGPB12]|uniref:response regulator transcription factor n=1 Tax=Brachybacterium sp. GPGPB12 TaxID=3023517 RepID=UPI003134472B
MARLVAQGLANPEIGATLFMSVATVKTHLGRLYQKPQVTNRVRLAIAVLELGAERVSVHQDDGGEGDDQARGAEAPHPRGHVLALRGHDGGVERDDRREHKHAGEQEQRHDGGAHAATSVLCLDVAIDGPSLALPRPAEW